MNTYRNCTTGEITTKSLTLLEWMERRQNYDLIDEQGKTIMTFRLKEEQHELS